MNQSGSSEAQSVMNIDMKHKYSDEFYNSMKFATTYQANFFISKFSLFIKQRMTNIISSFPELSYALRKFRSC